MNKKILLALISMAFAIVLLPVGRGSAAPENSVASTAARSKRKALYLTHSAGFKHEILPLSEEIMKQIAERSGEFEIDATKDCSLLSRDNLKRYDAVIFYTTGELPISDAQKADLLAFIKSGKGFVGIHSATDTFYKWPEYGEMIGGYFDQHPWHKEVTVNVEDRRHPATRHLGNAFKITDEIYQFKEFSRDRAHVLMSLDTNTVDLTLPAVHRKDKDFAIAWCRNYGRGRVFYTALGHRAEVWQDLRFQLHLLGALRWVVGGK
jgi:type 1 glutamine amidotransferase